MRVRVFLTSRSTRFLARSPRRSNFLRSVVTCFCRRVISRSAVVRVRYLRAVSATFSAPVRTAPTYTRAGRWAWSASSWTWNVSALARWVAAVVAAFVARAVLRLAAVRVRVGGGALPRGALRWAALRLRVAAEALPRALRCVAVVFRFAALLRRVLLLRRRVVVLLVVDILFSSSGSCLLGILLELIPCPQKGKPPLARS